MAIIGQLAVSVVARTQKFQKDMRSAAKSISRFSHSVARSGARLAAFGGAAAAAGTAAALYVTKRVIEAGDAMDKLSKRTGLSAEFLSKLSYAADLSGTSMEDIEKGMRTLSKAALDSSRGLVTYQRDFNLLGVEVTDASGNLKEIDKLFIETSTALSQVSNSTERAALAANLFGRSGTRMLPLLSEGAAGFRRMMEEAEKLGFVWTSKTSAAAAQLNDDLARVSFAIKGAATQFIVEMMPAIDKTVQSVIGFVQANKELVSSKISEWATAAAATFEAWWNTIQRWATDNTFLLWWERLRATWLGLNAVWTTVIEGVKAGFYTLGSAVHAIIGGIIAGWDWMVNRIKAGIAEMLKAAGSALMHVKGMQGVGISMNVAGGRMGAEAGAERFKGFANQFTKTAGRGLTAAFGAGGNITGAWKEYASSLQNIADLQERAGRGGRQIFKAGAAAAVAGMGAKAAAPGAALGAAKIGQFREIDLARMAIGGGAAKRQEVEDKKGHEILRSIDAGIKNLSNNPQPAILGA